MQSCEDDRDGKKIQVMWHIIFLTRTPSGPAVLSFVERSSSFRGDFNRVCTLGLSFIKEVCPLSECPLLEVSP